MRVLLTGWPSFVDGEATAGDVLSLRSVRAALAGAGIDTETAWSPVFRPDGLRLEDADPARYSDVVFVCGPAHGPQVRRLHERFPDCRRIAAGVSVLNPDDPAVTGFHRVFARDEPGGARPDLAWHVGTDHTPVIGVALAPGQREYGGKRRHDVVHAALGEWLTTLDCARLPLDTRLDTRDWRNCATPDQFASLVSRLDALVTTRLHGLVFGLRAGIPVLAVDPVAGGGKVSAQARVLGWPALVGAESAVEPGALDHWWAWCLSERGRVVARRRPPEAAVLDELVSGLRERS
ncbi:polysaccharide pyruvyl transferase family protein [Amycolatopsis sp. 195334CR]|uniref:polysaccharide pyruvyl transferase family protein n=1 Tax=Amycolatopsis sp. 195334CR TaxID=2814588 RepID=UPI001A8D7065|nr:polysaccharide pyruvyl transferase family protein [Amycolatopsis sp. 195334CR]MBN6038376.1 polysaccharide pyruvyl transferase family protein [Amycolatopsis sp. 195334CR]